MDDIERLRAADLEFATRPWRINWVRRYGGNLANDTAQRAAGKAPELAMGYCGDTVQYGRSPAGPWFEFNGTTDYLEIPIYKFNNSEGEKAMEKIDWHKPLRAFKTPGHEVVDAKVYTYKSGRQRVVWVDERVYPVDDQGRAVANVDYGLNWVQKGHQIVENVPEEKFFLGLSRSPNGAYWLTDGGVPTTMSVLAPWSQLMKGAPHWIVDTRKSAEPPKAIEHDPEDYVTVWFDNYDDEPRVSGYARTKSEAEASVSEPGEQVVRVRTTPAPVDTSRYIHLYRDFKKGPWVINAFGKGRQEMTWAEAKTQARYLSNEHCVVKVRD